MKLCSKENKKLFFSSKILQKVFQKRFEVGVVTTGNGRMN
jgi:hypothetical protein